MNQFDNIDSLSIQTIRTLCLEMIDKANSGHPGMALGSAPILHTLFTKVLNISPKNPKWVNRDRFILSSGHASSLLYVLLHLSGFGLKVEDLQNFRQLKSLTPGHPEEDKTLGVDASTGPLGQGIAYGVGTAMSEMYVNSMYPELVNHYTYVLCGDGDIQEGISKEAMSLAGYYKLNKLIVIYDSNDVQLDGTTDKSFNEDLSLETKAFHWNYIKVSDGNDCAAVLKAIKKAQKSDQPTLIEVKTIIGDGLSQQGTNKVHGAPAPHEDVVRFRNEIGGEPFYIDPKVYEYYKKTVLKHGNNKYVKWSKLPMDEEFMKFVNNDHTVDFSKLPVYPVDINGKKVATRVTGGEILKVLSEQDKFFIGGAADIASSTKTSVVGGTFSKENPSGRNIMFGVRELAMGAICNAITRYGLKSFASTFFVFSDYMKPTIRLAALSKLPTMFIFSHDSIAVGEDGPTHQPMEQLSMCRAIPNTVVVRPCDGNETREAYKLAYQSKTAPYIIVLTRQGVPTVSENPDISKGAYIISREDSHIDGILIAAGSEVSIALEAKELLKQRGYDIRVVSMPSIDLFDKQSDEYKEEILPKYVKNKMAVEMGDGINFFKYVGTDGYVFNLEAFGTSGKASDVMTYFGFTKENICESFIRLDHHLPIFKHKVK